MSLLLEITGFKSWSPHWLDSNTGSILIQQIHSTRYPPLPILVWYGNWGYIYFFLLPSLPKLPSLYYLNALGNLGSLGSIKEIQSKRFHCRVDLFHSNNSLLSAQQALIQQGNNGCCCSNDKPVCEQSIREQWEPIVAIITQRGGCKWSNNTHIVLRLQQFYNIQ